MTTKLFSDILPGDHFLATEGMQNIGIEQLRQGDLCICTHADHLLDTVLFQIPNHPEPRVQKWEAWAVSSVMAPTVEIVVGGMQ